MSARAERVVPFLFLGAALLWLLLIVVGAVLFFGWLFGAPWAYSQHVTVSDCGQS